MTRHWPALFAWGAGLLLVAMAAGSSPVWAVALALVGATALGWGVFALRAGGMTHPLVVLASALSAVAVALGAGIAGGVPGVPLGAAVLLLFGVAGWAAGDRRRALRVSERGASRSTPPGRPGRALLGLLLGAAIVSGIATPALAMTDAGDLAVPHGEMPGHGGMPGHSGH